jgi:hypothetical protein
MHHQFTYAIRRLKWACVHMASTYRYRVDVAHAHGIVNKCCFFLQSFWTSFVDRKRIFFYPEAPRPFCVIYKILKFLGYRVITAPRKHCNLAIKYWHGFDGNPYSPDRSFPPVKMRHTHGNKLLNAQCNDISKKNVNAVFEEIFGYPISVDPRKHVGKCVMKLNWNALHKGQIIECPAELQEGDFVYQKLINNETEDGFVEDMRVPVYKNRAPLVYLKYRSVKNRFIDRPHTNTKVKIVEVSDMLSENELLNIYHFCGKIGMDYGELDVLRDRNDDHIYIVDANIAPSGPPSPISDEDARRAIVKLSHAFEEAFCA